MGEFNTLTKFDEWLKMSYFHSENSLNLPDSAVDLN